MSLNGMMRTGVSGMNAQANRLSTVSENIANSDTTGYKRATTEFSSLVLPNSGNGYNSGAITTDVRYNITRQGELEFTQSATDLAIEGNGFFIVQDANGNPFLTRSGSFVPNGRGELVNAAGFTLLGYEYDGVDDPNTVINGFNGLAPVNVSGGSLAAVPSTSGNFDGNLPAGAEVGDTETSSLVVFDNLGNEVLVDLTFTKITDANPPADQEQWSLVITDRETGAILNQPVPADPADLNDPAVHRTMLTFDNDTGKITGLTSLQFNLNRDSGTQTDIAFDLSRMTALGYPYDVSDAGVDGSAPSKLEKVQIDTDGTVYGQYENGDLKPLYKLAMATVQSPDKLEPLPGNVYQQGVDSGVMVTGFAQSGNFGQIVSGALEGSNVDIAEELTTMIEAQRAYTANSKSFQTGSELMEILVNLKR